LEPLFDRNSNELDIAQVNESFFSAPGRKISHLNYSNPYANLQNPSKPTVTMICLLSDPVGRATVQAKSFIY
jgi:hypothetical protein